MAKHTTRKKKRERERERKREKKKEREERLFIYPLVVIPLLPTSFLPLT